jgi:hypothetical protein
MSAGIYRKPSSLVTFSFSFCKIFGAYWYTIGVVNINSVKYYFQNTISIHIKENVSIIYM